MTQLLQLLVFVGAVAGLIAFGFNRDKREHRQAQSPDELQRSIDFPQYDPDGQHHKGAAMSRVR